MATIVPADSDLQVNPASNAAALFERAVRVMPSGYTRDLVAADPHPDYAAHAEGCWITDVEGRRRIDWVNNFASMIHGHGRREIVEIIASQASRLMAAVLPTEWEVALAELLVARVPGIERIRFMNSGTEANSVATKAARAFTGRSRIAKIEGGYHGQFDLLELSFQPSGPGWGDAARPRPVAHNPGTPQSLMDELVVLPLNDIENSRAILRAEADTLAALFIDPWRLQTAMVEPRLDYLTMLREETERLGILLVFDEVVSLRVGPGGTQGMLGITPDLTTVGKIIGGGLPIGGVGGRAAIMQVFDMDRPQGRVKHSGTFTANPMSMATGHTSMTLLDSHAFAELERKSGRLREALCRVHHDLDMPGEIAGAASLTSLMLADGPITNYRQLAHAMASGMAARLARLQALMVEEGIFTLRGSFVGSTAMTDDDIDFTIAGATRAFRRMAAG